MCQMLIALAVCGIILDSNTTNNYVIGAHKQLLNRMHCYQKSSLFVRKLKKEKAY
jgi:hypothetical protein